MATQTHSAEPAQAAAPLASDLCWLLSRASHGLTTEFTAALEELGISPRQHSVLFTAMTGEFTQTEIARMVGLDKTTMVVTVDELEAAGLAERRPSSTDRRARVIVVTDAGVRRVLEAEEVLDGVRDDVLSVLAPDERHVFLKALGTLACGRLAEPVACTQPVRRRA
jgi:MarR family transcriptional regulator for hemolysin